MKTLWVLVALAGVAGADGFPNAGPCDDVDGCEQACKKGKTPSCTYGGVIAMQSAVDEPMKARGLALFDKACTKGDAEACWFAARRVGDDAKSRKYYEKACTKQHVRSCIALARLPVDAADEKARKAASLLNKKVIGLLEPRCEAKNDAFACQKLVELYEQKVAETRERVCQVRTGQPCPQPATHRPHRKGL
jgi:hypothetical protein